MALRFSGSSYEYLKKLGTGVDDKSRMIVRCIWNWQMETSHFGGVLG